MKMSSKMERCGLSPMRKFNPYAAKTKERGIKIYHLNIGQPDVETPAPFYEALRSFSDKVVSYAPSSGLPVFLDAVRDYYRNIGVELTREQILPTTGGSEALQLTFATILDDGDEVVIPEPFYPNYHTSVTLAGASIQMVGLVSEIENELDVLVQLKVAAACATIGDLVDKVEEQL